MRRFQYEKEEYKEHNIVDTEIESNKIGRESRKIISLIFRENRWLYDIFKRNDNFSQVKKDIRSYVMQYLNTRQTALDFYNGDEVKGKIYHHLSDKDIAAIRILDYINHEGEEFEDLNLRGKIVISRPFKQLWKVVSGGGGGASPAFYKDMLFMLRQFNGYYKKEKPGKTKVEMWMKNHPSGLDEDIVEIRKRNKDRIIRTLIKLMDNGDILRPRYRFKEGMTFEEKYNQMLEWWEEKTFHLQFAARSPERINKLLGRKVDSDTMKLLFQAQDSGIPFFVNPYYLTLLFVDAPEQYKNKDYAIHDYVFVSKPLVDEFGHIVAWEKEDIVKPGEPNAAGWILPSSYNIHRRYPEVAILIPDTVGRACGGLCVSCQRMYDFQRGHLNFDLNELHANETWWKRLPKLLEYFENDSQLRDILITGGDALMSTDNSLKRILDAVYQMALNKIEANKLRPEGEKYAEMVRVRLGTRLPVYLPQRITKSLIKILTDFRRKAKKIGIKQFVIQTHFESALEVTPEAAQAVKRLLSAGWIVTNQLVFTTAASRRGHTAKLRKVLNDIGVITYYTFSVKGYNENRHNFTPNARVVQECIEEKSLGEISYEKYNKYIKYSLHHEGVIKNINHLRELFSVPFLSTDRSVMNLPGVGKSLSFRTIGITNDGRRILQFDHDSSRNHSPIIKKMGKVIIIESKSIDEYLKQIEQIGDDISEYEGIWGYSLGQTEPRFPLFEYPEYDFKTTNKFTNIEV